MEWCCAKTRVVGLNSRRLQLLCKVKYVLRNVQVLHSTRPSESCPPVFRGRRRSRNLAGTSQCYSTSGPETPAGDRSSQTSLRLLKRLNRRVHLYFKQKDVSVMPSNISRRTSGEIRSCEASERVSTSAWEGPQLFHMSSLATRFGESYRYVARHINSVLPRSGLDKCVEQQSATKYTDAGVEGKTAGGKAMDAQGSLVDTPRSGYEMRTSLQDVHTGVQKSGVKSSAALDQTSAELHHLTAPGLFHTSRLSTGFGENYSFMAHHINRYFGGHTGAERNSGAADVPEEPGSLFQQLLRSSALPGFMERHRSKSPVRPPKIMLENTTQGRRKAEHMTKGLLNRLQEAPGPSSITSCLEELNSHLMRHPVCKAVMWQEKAALHLLRRRRVFWMDEELQAAVRVTLALIGYADPIKGCGIRVLSIDGGGTKGIVPLQVLKQLEARTGKRVHELFDYICGVSTGAVLAFMLGLARISIEECEDLYRRFGSEVFRQNPLVGTVKMGWTHSYYNTETWEKILREKMGEEVLIRTSRCKMSPKVSAVSAVVNCGTSPKAFIFRNYNHAPGRLSRYAGGSGFRLWQAVRASSAAPGYFQEFPLHGDVHQDGGLILNNPCALAVHESRLLWPGQPFQMVLSLGTGRYHTATRRAATSTSLTAKITNLICSATDTEGVHTLLDELLSPNVYFRFNPMTSFPVTLDESRAAVLTQLQAETQLYLERNRPKLERVCAVLMAERTVLWKTRDWISEKAWELQQRWA